MQTSTLVHTSVATKSVHAYMQWYLNLLAFELWASRIINYISQYTRMSTQAT